MWNLHPPSRGYLIEFIIIQLLSEMATKSFPSNEDHSLTHQASTAAQAYKLEWATQFRILYSVPPRLEISVEPNLSVRR